MFHMSRNPRITPKDRNLIKGAMRRAFARSDIHKQVIEASIIPNHSDPKRPRVKTWCRCSACLKPEAKSYMVVDHRDPVIPTDSSFEEMTIDEVADRMWCSINNLDVMCKPCHDIKSKAENSIRKVNKKNKGIKNAK